MSEMSETVLKVPIYINGGDNPPTALHERELYLNLTTAHLYAGLRDSSMSLIRAGYADCLSNNSITITASLESSSSIFKLGNMSYDFSNNTLKRTASEAYYSVDGAKLTNINKLVLSTECYGDRLPDIGEQGQLFFKIG